MFSLSAFFWKQSHLSSEYLSDMEPVKLVNLVNFEQLLKYFNSLKPHLLLVTGNFNVRSLGGGLMVLT